MITYDSMSEGWIDDEDPDFFVGMTPEGSREELDLEFNTRQEFLKWYNS